MKMKWLVAAAALAFLAMPCATADTVTYTYDDAGRLTGVAYANGTSIAYAYDAAGNLLARTVTAPASGNAAPKPAKGKESKRESPRGAGSGQAKRPQRDR